MDPNYAPMAPMNLLVNPINPPLMIEWHQPAPVPVNANINNNNNLDAIPRKLEMVPTGRSDLEQPSQKVAKLQAIYRKTIKMIIKTME
jgi:hypothetical protein